MRPLFRLMLTMMVGLTLRASVLAESWYPLKPGTTWVYAYRNVLAYSGSPGAMTNVTEGTMTARVVGLLTTNGQTYAQTETTYSNIFAIPPQTLLLREDATGVYVADVLRGEFYESAIIKLPVAVAQPWPFFDGEHGQREVVAREPMTLAARTWTDTIRVVRRFGTPEKDGMWTQESVYAPGAGEIRFRFVQRLGPTLSDTTTELRTLTIPP